MTRIVSSPPIVPTASGQLRAIDGDGERLGLPDAGADDDQLLHVVDALEELAGGALERGQRRRRDWSCRAPGRW